jgi:hypothetical protein
MSAATIESTYNLGPVSLSIISSLREALPAKPDSYVDLVMLTKLLPRDGAAVACFAQGFLASSK